MTRVGQLRCRFGGLLVAALAGMGAGWVAPMGATSQDRDIPVSGIVRGEYRVTTHALGVETLLAPVKADPKSLGFRVQHQKGTVPSIGYQGQMKIRYQKGAIAVRLPNGQGWLFATKKAAPNLDMDQLGGRSLVRLPAFGLAKYAARPVDGRLATPLTFDACECPGNPNSCLAGGRGATSCEYECSGPCSVECEGTHACCWCTSGFAACCKCCGPFDDRTNPNVISPATQAARPNGPPALRW